MTKSAEPSSSQSKKKRDDNLVLPSNGHKPVQLQRRRVWRACESCRRKKIKCDGCEPTCSQCVSSGAQCTWLQTKDRAALSRHYVQELEARLLHMESLFSQVAPILEQLGPTTARYPTSSVSATTTNAVDPQNITANLNTYSTSQQHLHEPTTPVKEEGDFSESFGQLALDENGHMRWIGGSSTMSLIQSFRAITSSPLRRISPIEEDPHAPGPSANKLYFPASIFPGKLPVLPGPEEVEYPDRDLADKLVEAYFSRLHFLMPVVDKPTFFHDYKRIMDNKNDAILARSEAPFLSLVFALFACAARLVQDPRLATAERGEDGGMSMVYYERALILQYISHSNIQIAHVQCFVLMSSFLCSVNCLPQAWLLIGQAVRTAQDLGLHRTPRRLIISAVEKETRRKVWWSVYTMDRMLALALGRPLGINDSDCDVEQPAEIDDEDLPEYFSGGNTFRRNPALMTGSVALNKLYEIGGRVLRQVYGLDVCKEHVEAEKKVELQRVVESLDNELNQWCEALPAVFKSQSETDEQLSLGAALCSHYYSILITLHRNLLPVKRDQPQLPSAQSTAKAVSSARACIRLAPSMRHVVPPSHHLAFFVQHLFSSAVILLLYAMHAPDPRASAAAMEEARSSLAALESWEGNWPGARKCKDLLIDLTNTANEAIAQAAAQATTSVSTSPNPVSILPQRRRSVTITTPASSSVPGRVGKSKSSRRNPSRDPNVSSSRRLAAVSPYRVDSARRARSSSCRRGPDDPESVDRGLYYHTLANSASGSSQHSSPDSGNLPSPSAASAMEDLDTSPHTSNTTPFAAHNSPQMTALRLNYEYGMQPSPLSQTNTHQWVRTGEGSNLDLYTTDNSAAYFQSFEYPNTLDPAYAMCDAMGGAIDNLPMSPTSSFPGTGLPFRGLDYIKNYNPVVYAAGDDNPLWKTVDPGAFGFDPELPFNISDAPVDLHDTSHLSQT